MKPRNSTNPEILLEDRLDLGKRAYDTESFATFMSLGAFCSNNSMSSPYYCPAVCDGCNYTICKPGDRHRDRCNCEPTPPKNSSDYACPLEHLKLDVTKIADVPVTQYYLIMVAGVVAFVVALYYLHREQLVSLGQIKKSVVTSAEFTVYVEGLPCHRAVTIDEVANFFCHYGDVAAVAVALDQAGPFIRHERQLAELSEWQNEIKLYQENAPTAYDMIWQSDVKPDQENTSTTHEPPSLRKRVWERFLTCISWPCFYVYAYQASGVRVNSPASIANLDKRIDAMDQARKQHMKYWSDDYWDGHNESMPYKCAGTALVTFNYRCHAANCLRDQRDDWVTWFLAQMPRVCGPGSSLWNRLHGCCCCTARLPLFDDENEAGHPGYRLHVKPAPEPQDVLWENIDPRMWRLVIRRTASILVTTLVILAGASAQLFLAREKERMRSAYYEEARKQQEESATYEDERISWTKVRLWTLSLCAAAIILLINEIIGKIVDYASEWEELPTRTKQEAWKLWKLSISFLINSAALPLITIERKDWYVPGGLVDQAILTMGLNIIFPDLLEAWDPVRRVGYWFLARHARTQKLLDDLVQPLDVSMASYYAIIIKTVGLALLYAPALPISYPVAFASMIVSYYMSKGIFLRDRQPPAALQLDLHHQACRILKLLVLLQLLLAYLVYYERHADALVPFVIGVALWAVLAWAPEWSCFTQLCPVPESKGRGPPANLTFVTCRQKYEQLLRERTPSSPGLTSTQGADPYGARSSNASVTGEGAVAAGSSEEDSAGRVIPVGAPHNGPPIDAMCCNGHAMRAGAASHMEILVDMPGQAQVTSVAATEGPPPSPLVNGGRGGLAPTTRPSHRQKSSIPPVEEGVGKVHGLPVPSTTTSSVRKFPFSRSSTTAMPAPAATPDSSSNANQWNMRINLYQPPLRDPYSTHSRAYVMLPPALTVNKQHVGCLPHKPMFSCFPRLHPPMAMPARIPTRTPPECAQTHANSGIRIETIPTPNDRHLTMNQIPTSTNQCAMLPMFNYNHSTTDIWRYQNIGRHRHMPTNTGHAHTCQRATARSSQEMVGNHVLDLFACRSEPWPRPQKNRRLKNQKPDTLPRSPPADTSAELATSQMQVGLHMSSWERVQSAYPSTYSNPYYRHGSVIAAEEEEASSRTDQPSRSPAGTTWHTRSPPHLRVAPRHAQPVGDVQPMGENVGGSPCPWVPGTHTAAGHATLHASVEAIILGGYVTRYLCSRLAVPQSLIELFRAQGNACGAVQTFEPALAIATCCWRNVSVYPQLSWPFSRPVPLQMASFYGDRYDTCRPRKPLAGRRSCRSQPPRRHRSRRSQEAACGKALDPRWDPLPVMHGRVALQNQNWYLYLHTVLLKVVLATVQSVFPPANMDPKIRGARVTPWQTGSYPGRPTHLGADNIRIRQDIIREILSTHRQKWHFSSPLPLRRQPTQEADEQVKKIPAGSAYDRFELDRGNNFRLAGSNIPPRLSHGRTCIRPTVTCWRGRVASKRHHRLKKRLCACFFGDMGPCLSRPPLGHADPEELAAKTNFTVSEVEALFEMFKGVSSSLKTDGVISKAEFQLALFKSDTRSVFADRVFDLFDTEKNGMLDFREFVRGLSVFHAKAPVEDKANFAFRIYDMHDTGFIEREEVYEMLLAMLRENPDLPLPEEYLQALLDKTFSEADLSGDGKISLEEWRALVAKNPAMLSNMTIPSLSTVTTDYPAFIFNSVVSTVKK
eukprot:jgi/Mesvir1/26283/Mv01647-RA.1